MIKTTRTSRHCDSNKILNRALSECLKFQDPQQVPSQSFTNQVQVHRSPSTVIHGNLKRVRKAQSCLLANPIFTALTCTLWNLFPIRFFQFQCPDVSVFLQANYIKVLRDCYCLTSHSLEHCYRQNYKISQKRRQKSAFERLMSRKLKLNGKIQERKKLVFNMQKSLHAKSRLKCVQIKLL